MREFRSLGSVRVAPGNRRPYREHFSFSDELVARQPDGRVSNLTMR